MRIYVQTEVRTKSGKPHEGRPLLGPAKTGPKTNYIVGNVRAINDISQSPDGLFTEP